MSVIFLFISSPVNDRRPGYSLHWDAGKRQALKTLASSCNAIFATFYNAFSDVRIELSNHCTTLFYTGDHFCLSNKKPFSLFFPPVWYDRPRCQFQLNRFRMSNNTYTIMSAPSRRDGQMKSRQKTVNLNRVLRVKN